MAAAAAGPVSPNIVVVALAAKVARIVWAVLRHEKSFDQGAVLAA